MAKSVLEILINAKNNASKAFKSAAGDAGRLEKSLGGINRVLAGVGLAVGAKEMFDFGRASIEAAAAAERLGVATDNLARGIGSTAKELTSGIGEASAGTVDQITALQAANKALLFGLVENGDQMKELTNIAVTLGSAMGQDASKSLDDLTTALGRQSPMILDNLGITLKLEEAYQIYAASLGKTVEALTEQEKKQAFVNAALEKGRERVEQLGGITETNATKVERLSSAFVDFQIAMGDLIEVSGGLDALTGVIDRLEQGATRWKGAFKDVAAINELAAKVAEKTGRSHASIVTTMLTGVGAGEDYEAALSAVNVEMDKQQAAANRAAAGASLLASYAREAADAEGDLQAAMERANSAMSARYTGMADAYQRMYGADQVDFTRTEPLEWIDQQAAAEEAAADERKDAWKDQQSEIKQAITDMANSISGAVNEAFGRMQETIPGLSEMFAAEDPGEFGRRLGALAQEGLAGFDPNWSEAFTSEAGGNPLYDALLESIQSGDSEAVAAEANRLLSENLAQVIATGLKDSIKAQIEQQNIMEEAQRLVAEELGQPIEGDTSITTTAQETQTELDNIKTKSGETASAIKTDFENAIEPIDLLNERLRIMNDLLDGAIEKSGKATDGISGMNVPGGSVSSQTQMGGVPTQ